MLQSLVVVIGVSALRNLEFMHVKFVRTTTGLGFAVQDSIFHAQDHKALAAMLGGAPIGAGTFYVRSGKWHFVEYGSISLKLTNCDADTLTQVEDVLKSVGLEYES